jgi:hypothetical protein
VSEQEYTRTINAAIANTEDEIFREASAETPLEHDGDTSLEEMGEGLEGEEIEEEGEEGGEADDDSEEGEEAGEAEGEEGDGKGDEPQPQARGRDQQQEQPRDQRGKFQQQGRDQQQRDRREPAIPPARLRETTARAQTAEERAERLERELAEMRGRLDEVSRRATAPPAQQQEQKVDAEPDMFADPEGWKSWNRRQAEQIAKEHANNALAGYRQEQQQQEMQRLDTNLQAHAWGRRGFEFNAAYQSLTRLDPRDPQAQALVRNITRAADPGQAILDWFEETGGAEDFRESILEQLQPRQNGRGVQPRQQQQSRQPQPRQVFRGPRTPPSLNGAQGSNSQREHDPEMLDGSDGSVFEYATRR